MSASSVINFKGLSLLGIALFVARILSPSSGAYRLLDSFEDLSRWIAAPADGVMLKLSESEGFSGKAMKLDFDYQGNSGWAAVRKNFAIKLPENYEFSFLIRGDAPITHFEFKLVDATGQNVWWVNQRNFEYPQDWRKVTLKKRQISFAWGPAGGGELQELSAIEFAITSAAGGKGTVLLDDLILRELPPVKPYSEIPQPKASSEVKGYGARNALDGKRNTFWKSGPEPEQTYEIDFRQVREFGGIVIDWDQKDFARDYEIQISEDQKEWNTIRTVRGTNGGRDYSYLPETESRFVRIRLLGSSSGNGFGIGEIEIMPLEFGSSPNSFFSSIAKDAPRGHYPRGFSGELSYWTVVGNNGEPEEGLLNEDGTFEPSIASYSVEPFLFFDGHLVTWNDVETAASLAEGYLPVPTVRWVHEAFFLDITALPTGESPNSRIGVQYTFINRTGERKLFKLFLAIRPFQVNPPSQFLNTSGGTVPVRNLKWDGSHLTINRKHSLFSSSTRFGASSFDQGDIIEYLRLGKLPGSREVEDPIGYASGAFEYELALDPNGRKDLTISSSPVSSRNEEIRSSSKKAWKETLNLVDIRLPAEAQQLVNILKSNLAYILINRDGSAIQPGSRAYARSWIRDGSLTSSALLRLGQKRVVQQFIEWYAGFQYPNGKVPCCVDIRGADPVAEHDSHGEFIYIIAEYYRYTKDREFLVKLWPNVAKAVAYIDSLRKQRRTGEYQKPEKRMFFGLLPESISHEGYSAKPVHSYWDDFFALRGLKDAVEIATVLGKEAELRQFIAIRDEFKTDLYESLSETISHHKIDYIPGSADLGDFDATSTTTAISPGGELETLPQKELLQTFERYYQESIQREKSNWKAYTPYELRTVGTFVRLGWKDRAHQMLRYFLQHQRPAGWNHWAEVVHRDARAPNFIGDMPHTWVGSDFIRSFLDFFAYESEIDQSLVLGAGIPSEWVRKREGISIQNLQTTYGPLTYSLHAINKEARYRISAGMKIPPGGIILTWPFKGKFSLAIVNKRPVKSYENRIVIRELPSDVVLQE